MRRSTLLLGFSILILLGPSAWAGDLHSGPLQTRPDNSILCMLRNVGKTARSYTITAKIGNAVSEASGIITPNTSQGAAVENETGGSIFGFCSFTFNGSRKKMRATACARDDQFSPCRSAIPAE